jgi:hypothetical protein
MGDLTQRLGIFHRRSARHLVLDQKDILPKGVETGNEPRFPYQTHGSLVSVKAEIRDDHLSLKVRHEEAAHDMERPCMRSVVLLCSSPNGCAR